jgi:glycosyltransferase involved in cell wall biosynthesis
MSYTYFTSPSDHSVPFSLCIQGSPEDSTVIQRLTDELAKQPWLTLQSTEQDSTELLFLVGDPVYVHSILTNRTSSKKVWVYLLQRYEVLDPSHVEVLNHKADRLFATNREWRTLQRQQGITRPLDVLLPPPCTKGRGDRRTEGRLALQIPEEVFLILSMNPNSDSARYDTLIQAFVELLVKHPQKPLFLMCVCSKGGSHPIFDLFARALQQKRVNVADYSSRLLLSARYDSLTDEEKSVFYSIADCSVSCADGESVGLSVLDFLAHGIPQVLSHIVTHRALCSPQNSILVEPVVQIQCSITRPAYRQLVSASAVAQALETYLLDEPLRRAHGAAAASASVSVTGTGLMKRLDLLRQERDIDLDH